MDYKILDGFHFISRNFLLREDIPERKIYLNILSPSGNNEYLLYNFFLNVGDSIDMKNPISPFVEDAGYYQLDSIIPRPLTDGNEYNHFYLSPAPSNTISSNNAIWIEGAGSLSLINAPSGYPDINNVGHLSCSFKDGQSFYSNLDSIDSCEPTVILDVLEYDDPLAEVIVTSPILSNLCHVTNVDKVRYLEIYDLQGRKITELKNNGYKNIKIDFASYQSGVYIMILTSESFKKRTFKIIVG